MTPESEKSIKTNFAYNLLYQILAIIVPLFTSPYIARVLGAEKIGIYSWTYSITFYFMIFTLLGVNNYGNRTIAAARNDKEEKDRLFCSIYACQLFMSCIVVVGYIVYLVFICKSYKLIAWLQILYIFANMFEITWYYYGMEEFKSIVLRNVVIKFLSMACIFLFVNSAADLWKYTLILAGTGLLSQLLLWPYVFRTVHFSRPYIREISVHVKPIVVLFVPVLAISVFAYMDKYMIGKFSDVVQSGYYENVDKIIAVPKAGVSAFTSVLLPRTANLIANGEEKKSVAYIELSMAYVFLLGGTMIFGMAAVAEIFSVVFWGSEFVKCGKLLAYIMPSVAFSIFGNVIRSQFLIPRKKDKEYIISLVVGAAVNFVINLALIGRCGAMGAVVGTVAAEIVMTVIQAYCVRKDLKIGVYLHNGLGFMISGAVMFVVVRVVARGLENTLFSLVLLVLVGAVIYVPLAAAWIKFSNRPFLKGLSDNIWKRIRCGKGE